MEMGDKNTILTVSFVANLQIASNLTTDEELASLSDIALFSFSDMVTATSKTEVPEIVPISNNTVPEVA